MEFTPELIIGFAEETYFPYIGVCSACGAEMKAPESTYASAAESLHSFQAQFALHARVKHAQKAFHYDPLILRASHYDA